MMDFLRGHKMAAAALTALIQCGILLYMIQSRASILQNGTEVTLKTEPVDPRDLLRGDYVVLGYALLRGYSLGEHPAVPLGEASTVTPCTP